MENHGGPPILPSSFFNKLLFKGSRLLIAPVVQKLDIVWVIVDRSYARAAGNLIFVVCSDKINQWPYSRHGNISNNLSTLICAMQHAEAAILPAPIRFYHKT